MPGLINTTSNAVEVILQFRSVTFGALMMTWPVMFRPWITAPAILMMRSPDGVSVTPAGTPAFVASGHPPLGVVVAKVVLLVGSACWFCINRQFDPRSN